MLSPEHEIVAEWLFGDGIAAERFLEAIACWSFDPSNVFVALRGDDICGAIVAEPLPGKLSVISSPKAKDLATADALMQAALAHLRSSGSTLVQAYLEPAVSPIHFERHGFTFLTRMQNRIRRNGDTVALRDPILHFTPDADDAVMGATLLATYEGTLDAPETLIPVDGAEALRSFRHGTPTSKTWLATQAGTQIGVLILLEIPPDRGEIQYLGVVSSARGHGTGTAILDHALEQFRKRDIREVTVTVDARNTPACRMYDRAGFRVRKTHDLWIHRFESFR